jgi:hypothetical protein
MRATFLRVQVQLNPAFNALKQSDTHGYSGSQMSAAAVGSAGATAASDTAE